MDPNATYETLTTEWHENLLVVTVNRPDKLNALAEPVLNDLKRLLEGIRDAEDCPVRGLVLTGAGDKAFIAGADIAAMAAMDPETGARYSKLGQRVTLLLERVPVPVIAAVNGFALGGGCEMAMACDLIYASRNAVFGQPEIKLGLIPGFGGTQRLRRLVGPARARELIYTGRNVAVDEAVRLGLVQWVFEDREALLEGALQTLRELQAHSPLTLAQAKSVLHESDNLPLEEGLDTENSYFRSVFATEDRAEGMDAFLNRRAPSFKGR